MAVSSASLRQKLKDFNFRGLFIEELGWDHHRSLPLVVSPNECAFTLEAIAEKRGMVVFLCGPDSTGAVPDYATRRKIEKQVAKTAHEHIIIYTDAAGTSQTWQWVKRELGKPTCCREHAFRKGQAGDALIQRLEQLAVSVDEEEKGLNITDVTGKAKKAFDVDHVTKKFYERFKNEHEVFLSFIKGITSVADREWYASLMLNRLMFIYFIQKKKFLDDDMDYLRNRLRKMRERQGKGKFLTFYRHFLRRLFHEGLGQQESARKPDLDDLLGRVPYLNGGLFDVHQLERENTGIEIPDEAFEKLFDFFDAYQWHLDERPLRAGNEINPDVLGYIFEKYINQKQMGAYYTKEDITEYISKNTVIPFLFDAAAKECAIAFRPDSALWRLLRDDPDRYIYDAVRKGVDVPLPEDIAAGIPDVSKRGGWNRPAGPEYALPTETWREHVARRTRCLELRARLAAGEVHAINDLITYNLNIRQFAQDAIENCEGPELLRAFYHAIEKVSILDPTCGSGAFLFAALNILEPLYQACLDRMQAFVDDLDRSGEPHRPEKFSDLKKVLRQANDTTKHPSHHYFVLKSVVLNNLYGVDIMEEAVEICKLRLFLKLVAQVETADQIEPLPDIDFNIRAGNTLVGFTSLEAVRQSMTLGKHGQRRMLSADDEATLSRIEEDAKLADRSFDRFREQQTKYNMEVESFTSAKPELHRSLDKLRDQLDRYLAAEYGVDDKHHAAYNKWRKFHQPFHWFVEFYGVMKRGGFDVVIGNPPYVEYGKVRDLYRVKDFASEKTDNLYAFTLERSLALLKSAGRCSLIIPVSFVSSEAFAPLRAVALKTTRTLWLSHFANRPSQLFSGAQNRLSVVVFGAKEPVEAVFSTRYHRWDQKGGERVTLLQQLQYVKIGGLAESSKDWLPKVGSDVALSVIRKMGVPRRLGDSVSRLAEGKVYWVRVPGYFCQFFMEPPMAVPQGGGKKRIRGEVNSIGIRDAKYAQIICGILNSSTYYHFYCASSDGRHINPSDVLNFPIDLETIAEHTSTVLLRHSHRLCECMIRHTTQWRKSGLLIDSVDSRACKGVNDEIDHVLAQHYGFTDEEVDFIINYDIKYRMGQESEAEE